MSCERHSAANPPSCTLGRRDRCLRMLAPRHDSFQSTRVWIARTTLSFPAPERALNSTALSGQVPKALNYPLAPNGCPAAEELHLGTHRFLIPPCSPKDESAVADRSTASTTPRPAPRRATTRRSRRFAGDAKPATGSGTSSRRSKASAVPPPRAPTRSAIWRKPASICATRSSAPATKKSPAPSASELACGHALEELMGGSTDALKLVSSLTLFRAAAQDLAREDPHFDSLAQRYDSILEQTSAQGYPPCAQTLARVIG